MYELSNADVVVAGDVVVVVVVVVGLAVGTGVILLVGPVLGEVEGGVGSGGPAVVRIPSTGDIQNQRNYNCLMLFCYVMYVHVPTQTLGIQVNGHIA